MARKLFCSCPMPLCTLFFFHLTSAFLFPTVPTLRTRSRTVVYMQDKLTAAEQAVIMTGLQLVPSKKRQSSMATSGKKKKKKKDPFAADFASMSKLERDALLEATNPAAVDASVLIRAINVPEADRAKADMALRSRRMGMTSLPAFLPADKCARVREWVGKTVRGESVDSVDDCPEYQVSLTADQLSSLLGPRLLAALWALPAVFLEEGGESAAGLAHAISAMTERELKEKRWKGR
eukprot:760669-Hanusia_phi.AAC.1